MEISDRSSQRPGLQSEETQLQVGMGTEDQVEVCAAGTGSQMWTYVFINATCFMYIFVSCTSRLFVVNGPPTEVLPKLFEKWKITRLTFEVDTELYSQSRDKEVMKLAKEYGVEVIPKISHTLYNIDR